MEAKTSCFSLLLFVLAVFASLDTRAQAEDDAKLIYKGEYSGGVILHTRGYGANFRYGEHLSVDKKRIWTFDLLNLKHPKEQRSRNPFYEDAKSYYYGKLNSLFVLRTQLGYQNTISAKELRKGVEVNYVYSAGPAFAFLKPVYLEVAETRTGGRGLSTERYDPDQHSLNNIFGRAPRLTGLSETSVYPGLSLKFAMNFEYAPEDEKLRMLEVGMNMDAFHKEMEIMAYADNTQFWFTLYVNIFFGQKIL